MKSEAPYSIYSGQEGARMKSEAPYSPVLWSAIAIPVISATELFVDPTTRSTYNFFVLGSFYLVSVRYTLAVCLGVFAHDQILATTRTRRIGAYLWLCYFGVLVLCSLLVPGAAIFGMTMTLTMTMFVLMLSLAQGWLAMQAMTDKSHLRDTKWRIGLDTLLLVFLIIEIAQGVSGNLQSVFFGLCVLFAIDFTVSDFARDTLHEMYDGLSGYIRESLGSRPVVR